MNRSNLNFIVDSVAFFLFLLLASTGILIYFVLPPGSGNLTIWGMNRHGWGDIHFWTAMGFLLAMVIHLLLHWSWIVSSIKGHTGKEKSRKRIIISITAVVLALLFLLAPFFSPIEQGTGGEHGEEHTEQVDH